MLSIWRRLKNVWRPGTATPEPPANASDPPNTPAPSNPADQRSFSTHSVTQKANRTFNETDYLFRLAEQTLSLLQKTSVTDEEAHNRERAKELLTYRFKTIPSESHALAKELQSYPRFQEELSYLVNYTPSFWLVEREIPEIRDLRRRRGRPPEDKFDAKDYPYDWMYDNSVTGLCFSGGGIRSATFNLGILQGLAEYADSKGKPLLTRVDYLSTVSGGGYIHEWLAAWVKRKNLTEVARQLIPLPVEGSPKFHPAPIRWLRRYSSYLAPRRGVFSSDNWVALAVWLRNTFLNQLVLVSALVMLVLLPHFFVAHQPRALARAWRCLAIPSTNSSDCTGIYHWVQLIAAHVPGVPQQSGRAGSDLPSFQSVMSKFSGTPWILATFAIGFFALALIITITSLRAAKRFSISAECDLSRRRKWPGGGQKLAIAIVCLLLLSALFTSRLVLLNTAPECKLAVLRTVYLLLLAANIGLALAGGAVRAFQHLNLPSEGQLALLKLIWFQLKAYGGLVAFFSAVAAAAATALFALFQWTVCCFLPNWIPDYFYQQSPWRLVLVVGPALFLSVPFFSQVLLAGLIGRDFADWLREWLAGVRAWSLLLGVSWFVWVGTSLFAQPIMGKIGSLSTAGLAARRSAILAWLLTTAASVLAGRSGKTDGTSQTLGKGSDTLNILAVVGPYVFVGGLLLLLAWAAGATVDQFGLSTTKLFLLSLTVFALFGWRVDINEFSMHAFYRNRLTRCYLGATNTERVPNPLTGFDECDTRNLELSRFRSQGTNSSYEGPFPIFCAALNLTFGEDLAWQDRKAASFIFTPLYSGYHVGWTAGDKKRKLSYNGYVPTSCYAYPHGGINIATAVAISGAAVNPNQGYHTNPATAFLMTMFNVRLGWWLRNPRTSKFAGCDPNSGSYDPDERASPKLPALQLASEMLGMVDDTSHFVCLTDGGHFDNMGLYELIRRRCRYIIVCDAEEDHNYLFQGISTAIRRCRVDFGVDVELNLLPLRPQIDPHLGYGICKQHFVLGKVYYPERSVSKKEVGTILYIKASLTGQEPTYPNCAGLPAEPADIVSHKLYHDPFPNDTTVNQWFDEQLFESYRHLGLHIADEIAKCDTWAQVFP